MATFDFAKFTASAAVGGAVGFFAFRWVLTQGFYALVLPGFLLGMGAGFFPCRQRWWAYFAGFAALGLGLVSEWLCRPFVDDASFGFFVANLHRLSGLTWIMVLLGAYLGYQPAAARYREAGPRAFAHD